MTAPDDSGLLADAFKWLVAAAVTLIGLVWGDMRYRVHKLEQKLDLKAEKDEVNRQRDNVATLYEGQTEIRREIQMTATLLKDQLHKMHLDLLERIEERKQRR